MIKTLFWIDKFFRGGKTIQEAFEQFFKFHKREPSGLETIKIKQAFEKANKPSNVIEFPKTAITDWTKARPQPGSTTEGVESLFKEKSWYVGDTKPKKSKWEDDMGEDFVRGEDPDFDAKMDLSDKHSADLEKIDPNQGMSFYSELLGTMRKQDKEKLLLEYDQFVNKIFEKAKRVDTDPKILLEAELGQKITGRETTDMLLEIFKNRPKKADGGRIGFQTGGWADNLTGQAAAIYQSMNLGGHSDQTIQDTLRSLGYWDGDTGGGVENIINTQQSIIPGAGGGGGGGPTGPDSYTQTWTSEGLPAAAKTQTQPIGLTAAEQAWREGPFYGPKQNIGMVDGLTMSDVPSTEVLGMGFIPEFDKSGTVGGKELIGASPFTLGNVYTGEFDASDEGTVFDPNMVGQMKYQTPRTIGDQVYEQSLIDKETGIKTLGVPPPRTGLMGMWDKTKDFFSGLKGSPRVRGELGTRLANQPRLPLPSAMAGWSMSPFNPDSRNYNPNFVDQLNFLEMQDNMIGRDPNSGLLKYGPESVLAGKNVISMFGTNDYEEALQKKKAWFDARIRANKKYNKDTYDKLLTEIANTQKLEEERKVKELARIEAERAAGAAANQMTQRRAGKGGDHMSRSRDRGGLGISAAQAQSVSDANREAGMGGWGLKDGGLATMFTRRR